MATKEDYALLSAAAYSLEAILKCSERRQVGRARSGGAGMYSVVHEDSEHRASSRYQAQ